MLALYALEKSCQKYQQKPEKETGTTGVRERGSEWGVWKQNTMCVSFFFGFVFVSFSAFFVGLGSILNSFRLFFRVDKVGWLRGMWEGMGGSFGACEAGNVIAYAFFFVWRFLFLWGISRLWFWFFRVFIFAFIKKLSLLFPHAHTFVRYATLHPFSFSLFLLYFLFLCRLRCWIFPLCLYNINQNE